jgi:hypothetical protein
MAIKIEQYDILGQPLEVGNYVAVGKSNMLFIGQIVKITPKMIRAKAVNSKNVPYAARSEDGVLIYSDNTVKLSGEDAVAYVLKYAGT